ncbi:MAG: DNA replication/repair protein RecF [Anaerolineaceae bacterium]|jgi:DNA replication and repair protein RecF
MQLLRLSLTNFRSFSRMEMDIPGRVIILTGSNAQGKTSILEAVAFLASFRSQHATQDRELLNFNLTPEALMVGRIVGEFQKAGRRHTLEVRLISEANHNLAAPRFRKEILLDGVKKRPSELYGKFNAVGFFPQMSRIIEGPPSERRRFLDDALSQVEPGYARHLVDYSKSLSQRNALLKSLFERGGDVKHLSVWDEAVARHGAEVMRARIRFMKDLEQIARPIHSELTGEKEILRLNYQPSYEPLPSPKGQLTLVQSPVDRSGLDIETLENGFKSALKSAYQQDIARGMTTVGPHRDEFRVLVNKVDLGLYGSRGQMRTALLAMKFAEVEWMKNRTGEWPVLLLDEIMAELDTTRRRDLLRVVSKVEQALLTSTDPDMFEPAFLDAHEIWKVQNGMVTRLIKNGSNAENQ